MNRPILITGFGPFPGVRVNPTAMLVRRLSKRHECEKHGLATHVFTTSYATVEHEIPVLLKRHRPRAVIMLGVAARSRWLRIERFARHRSARGTPDRDGRTEHAAVSLQHSARIQAGPIRHKAMAAMRSVGLRSRFSACAGAYVCNAAYWRMMVEAKDVPTLFIHVPLPRQMRYRAKAWRPSLDQIRRAVLELARRL